MRFRELSIAAQTAYAELLESARAQGRHRTVADLNGSFASKKVKERTYWYFAYRDIEARVRQIYVGPDDDRVRKLIATVREARDSKPLAPLARSAAALGCEAAVPRHFRIVRRLSEYGFFRAGGVLVGTHAFLCLGNLLGVKFTDGSRTLDVDLAHAGKNISVALPADIKVDVQGALDSLEMGFLPITEMQGKAGTTYLNPKNPELRIDFVTSASRAGKSSVHVPNLNVALEPLKFMEFSLEDTTQAALLSTEGAVIVNIPSPARFAIHKLVVYGERSGASRLKSKKDLLQAASLIDALAAERADELRNAWTDALGRGPGWTKRAHEGLAALQKLEPKVESLKEWAWGATHMISPKDARAARIIKRGEDFEP
ncbi:GSU2403 family nucleotidyltransferase fold protein [Usitatibacter palustris]|uniref:Nucleotidyltransferase-like domain-containing protein n=1 Tax=Usitatibacter palustris TaxID=2732487 RepID=A0A6M4HA97_9PROT|nr:nucleotidyltransferase domain-containing protein [Usitatibacter palustris]QJR16719.1 hypothetical protein DSM104440_03555 [Usitatibacter palustris]